MSAQFERNLEKYADVIVGVGLNLQPGQRLLIMGVPQVGIYGVPLELAPLVRLVTTKAYQAGARLVDVMWNDEQLRLARFQHAPRDSFGEFPPWRADVPFEVAQAGDAVLLLYAENPDLLTDEDPDLISSAQQAAFQHMKPFSELRRKSATNCLIASAAVEGWPAKVFPDLPATDGKARLWDTIFEICRVKQPDPISAWEDHIGDLAARRDYLNQKRYAALRLTGPGTDLTAGLPRGHVWRSARMMGGNGVDYVGNIPTEEVFTIPHRDLVEGVVTSTKPLNLGGSRIEEFSLVFSGGRVEKATARKGEASLLKLLETDGGARRLGEVALVPHSSPISQSGLLFCNILFDENAASHLALGQAGQYNMEGGEDMSAGEFAAAGGNQSLIHVDFMVGSGEVDVDGLAADGTAEAVMRQGEWAFET
jgi:aminopeptidase